MADEAGRGGVELQDQDAGPGAIGETFGQVLQRHAWARPLAPALIYPGEVVAWQALNADVERKAEVLVGEGVVENDTVVIALPNSPEHHAWSFAAWTLGAMPCILPEKLPPRDFAQLIELAGPRVLVASAAAPSPLVRRIAPDAAPAAPGSIDLPRGKAARHWKAVSSGGSTGRPKLIVDHGEARFDGYIKGLIETLGLPSNGVVLNPGPLYHNGPFVVAGLALLAGNSVVGMVRFDAEACLQLIAEHRVQWVCLVPTMMHRIWKLPAETRARYDLSSLERVWHMAASCPAWLKRAWIDWLGPQRIFELYGGTECPGTIITGQEWLEKPGSVGKAEPGEISIHREDGSPCAPGEVGEIFLPPSALDRFHYLGAAPRQSAAARFSLGDLGHIDEDGYLFLADRRTDLILRGGANIYPAEIEGVLKEHPAVVEAIVLGLPHEEYGQRVHAVLELAPDTAPSIEEIDRFVRARLASYKRPETYELVQTRLRDDAGKARRSLMRDERVSWLDQGRPFQIRA